MTAEAYLEAVQPFSNEALRRSVAQFRDGMVPEHDATFVPSTAMLVRNLRTWEDVLHPRRRALLAAPPEPVISDEERARVGAGMQKLASEMSAKLEQERSAAQAATRARLRLATDRLLMDDPRSLSERLNLERFGSAAS